LLILAVVATVCMCDTLEVESWVGNGSFYGYEC
jgi:hypothetical protein